MTRILGFLLGVSYPTELLIMATLGLANSILNWKPFDLGPRLDKIRDLHFSINDVQFSKNFTSWTKILISGTVVMEFLCSMILPLTYLLILYPITTWGHSNILIPWLITHALSTILPKIISVTLAFIFYSEGIISTLSLMEFLVVESVNFLVASYNWYVFFGFYLGLRELERIKKSRKRYEKSFGNWNSRRSVYSSIPNIHEIFRGASANSTDSAGFRSVRSLSSLYDSKEISSVELSPTTNLTPGEKVMRFLKIDQDYFNGVRTSKLSSELPSLFGSMIHQDIDYTIQDEKSIESDSSLSESNSEYGCSCSSSDDEDDIKFYFSRKIQTEHPFTSSSTSSYAQSGVDTWSKLRPISKSPSEMTNQSTQVYRNLNKPWFNARVPPKFIAVEQHCKKDNDFHLLLEKNSKFVDSMCRLMSFKTPHAPQTHTQKWLIFRHEFESSLNGNVLFKEIYSRMNIPKQNDHKILMNIQLQVENLNSRKVVEEKNKIDDKKSFIERIEEMLQENKRQFVPMYDKTNKNKLDVPSTEVKNYHLDETEVSQSVDSENGSNTTLCAVETGRKPISSDYTSFRSSLRNSFFQSFRHRKSNISVLKSMRPLKWPEYVESQRVRELQNLQAYNNLTLEQDRKEMFQKKRRSRMTSYRNVTNELPLFNSDITINKQDLKIQDRACKSDQAQRKLDRIEKGQSQKQLATYREFLNSTNCPCEPSDIQEITDDTKSPDTKPYHYFSVEKELKRDNVQMTTNVIHTENVSFKHDNAESLIKPDYNMQSILTPEADKIHQPADYASLPQVNPSSMRAVIDRLDWSSPRPSASVPVQIPRRPKVVAVRQAEEQRAIVDDETLSLLQSAFSNSDEVERGLRVGAEMREPYPVFQAVVLTMNEIFKATGRQHSFVQPSDNELGMPITDDVILCGMETVPIEQVSRESSEIRLEEIEQRKNMSTCLLEELQQLLDSSRQTLSTLEHVRTQRKRLLHDKGQIPPNGRIEQIHVFKDLYNQGKKIKEDIEILESYVAMAKVKESESGGADVAGPSRQYVGPMDAEPRESKDVQGSTSGDVTDFSRNNYSRKQMLAKREARMKRKRVCETRFENRVQIHHFRKGNEGLTSGNVMEYDSEGRSLSLIRSHNPSLNLESENRISLRSRSRPRSRSKQDSKQSSVESNSKEFSNSVDTEVELKCSELHSNRALSENTKKTPSNEQFDEVTRTSTLKKEQGSGGVLGNEDISAFHDDPRYQKALEKHRQKLESDEIKNTIANWSKQDVESTGSYEFQHFKKISHKTVYFSDNSDMEEFPAD